MPRQTFTLEEIYSLALLLGLPDLGPDYYCPVFTLQTALIKDKDPVAFDSILAEILWLERLGPRTSTKPPAPLKEPALNGLWHKHFLMPDFVVRNIGIHWGLSRKGNQRFNTELNKFFAMHKGKIMDDRLAGELIHRIVLGGYEARASKKRLTGEWIVYGQADGKRYYLTIATHDESPEDIMSRIRSAAGTKYDFLLKSTL